MGSHNMQQGYWEEDIVVYTLQNMGSHNYYGGAVTDEELFIPYKMWAATTYSHRIDILQRCLYPTKCGQPQQLTKELWH